MVGSRINGWTLPFSTLMTPSCHHPFQRDGPGPKNSWSYPEQPLGTELCWGNVWLRVKNPLKIIIEEIPQFLPVLQQPSLLCMCRTTHLRLPFSHPVFPFPVQPAFFGERILRSSLCTSKNQVQLANLLSNVQNHSPGLCPPSSQFF